MITNICIVIGAFMIAYAAVYAILRVGCWCDGREW